MTEKFLERGSKRSAAAEIGHWQKLVAGAICIGFPIQKGPTYYYSVRSSTSSELQNCASLERPPPGIGPVCQVEFAAHLGGVSKARFPMVKWFLHTKSERSKE